MWFACTVFPHKDTYLVELVSKALNPQATAFWLQKGADTSDQKLQKVSKLNKVFHCLLH